MAEVFSQPDDLGEIRASELHSSLGESLSAQFGESFMSGARTLFRGGQYAASEGNVTTAPDEFGGMRVIGDKQVEEMPIDDAVARVKQEGLDKHIKLPEQPSIKRPVLDLMIAHGHERADYEAAVSRGPRGFIPDALGFATSIGAGIIDPVNIAAFSIPIMGEARFGMLMVNAGESLAARAGIRAAVGAGQGAVGGAALVPGDWWLHTKDGQDYTMAEALRSVLLSAGMGAAFHAGFGGLGDIRARMTGRPLEGSSEDQLTQALLANPRAAAEIKAGEARPGEEVPGVSAAPENVPVVAAESLPPNHPAHVLADLPPRAQEDVVRSAIADMTQDRPVRVGEMLQEAAKEDLRIAESLNGAGRREKAPQSLLEFIAANGGISEKDPLVADFLQSFGGKNPALRGIGKLVRSDGKSLDAMREAAVEAGYLRDPAAERGDVTESTINDLLSAVDSEARGQRQYPAGHEGFLTPAARAGLEEHSQHARAQFRRDANETMDTLLDDREITDMRKQLKARAFSIMEATGSNDPESAIRRSLDEFGMGRPEDAELSADAAVARSETSVTINGATRRDTRQRANWQQFEDPLASYDDPVAVAESKEAAATPEPASIDIEKAPSAAEAAAKDADKLLADIKEKLSDEEWRSLEDALNSVEQDKTAREQIARDGAACLAAAIA